jgi:hypothetical protein
MINTLLERLTKVKSHGRNSWRACCPAHSGTNPTALRIKEESDGRILLHCFQGCSASDVVASVGLQLSDLFPEPIEQYKAPIQKKFYASDILSAVKFECQVVLMAAFELKKNKELEPSDLERLEVAYERIREAIDYE